MFYFLPFGLESYIQDKMFEVNGLPKNDGAGGKQVFYTLKFKAWPLLGDMSNVGRKPAHVGLHSPNAPSFIEIETWVPGKFSSNLLPGCHDCREGVRVFRGSLASVPQ